MKVNVKQCVINGENIIDNPITVWYDKPLKWEKEVIDGETVSVQIEWIMCK